MLDASLASNLVCDHRARDAMLFTRASSRESSQRSSTYMDDL